ARTITLSEGRQSLYYEGHGEAVPVLRITVTAADGGTIPIEEHSGSVTYGVRGHNGESVAGIAIPRDGRYRVAVTPGPGGADARAILAIGPGVGSSIVEALVGAILLFIAAGAIGTVIIAVTFQRRRRARA
ncbi:hypothetical protein, partial [Paraconexibacter sp.]|uniref:hypothetical protein n=1 Tax=Paraconexibacter sp. TaxID=2949640 RepID=UPI003564CF70